MSIALGTGARRAASAEPARWRLPKRGYDVAVNYVSNEAAAQAVVAEIEALGVRSLAVRANTAELPEVKGYVPHRRARNGRPRCPCEQRGRRG